MTAETTGAFIAILKHAGGARSTASSGACSAVGCFADAISSQHGPSRTAGSSLVDRRVLPSSYPAIYPVIYYVKTLSSNM